MGYQNVRLGKAQLFDPSRVAGQLRVARKTPKNMQFLAFFGQNRTFWASTPIYVRIQSHMGYQNDCFTIAHPLDPLGLPGCSGLPEKCPKMQKMRYLKNESS